MTPKQEMKQLASLVLAQKLQVKEMADSIAAMAASIRELGDRLQEQNEIFALLVVELDALGYEVLIGGELIHVIEEVEEGASEHPVRGCDAPYSGPAETG